MSEEFKQAVFITLSRIPKGRVSTYGAVAKIAGYPGYGRHVGNVLKKLPQGSNLPWYRIINSQGKCSFPLNSESYNLQVKLLEEEGIVFLNGKVSLKKFGIWQEK